MSNYLDDFVCKVSCEERYREEDSMEIKWMVWRGDDGKIESWNIFNHYRFRKDVISALENNISKHDFGCELHDALLYSFWCKAEYEIVLDVWLGRSKGPRKIDIYQQVVLNFEVFVDYVWSFKGKINE